MERLVIFFAFYYLQNKWISIVIKKAETQQVYGNIFFGSKSSSIKGEPKHFGGDNFKKRNKIPMYTI